ncbi:hypothetical protein Tco_0004986 [Tanacetum coccineum]
MEADRLLALRLQEEKREQFNVEERAKFLHDTITAQRRFLAEQRAIAIRNRPPTRTQFRNQMMTYLRHKRLKKKVAKETLKKKDTSKVPAKVDVTEQGTKKRKGGHMKMLAKKRKRPQPDVDSDDEHRKCLKIVTFEGTIDSEIMERKYVIARLNKVSSPDETVLLFTEPMGTLGHLTISWRVYILELEDRTVIHMLVERRYPLSKDLLQRMLDLGLEVERESTAALDLIKLIKQQIDEK